MLSHEVAGGVLVTGMLPQEVAGVSLQEVTGVLPRVVAD